MSRELYRSPADAARIADWCHDRLEGWPVPHDVERLETGLGRTHLTWAGVAREALCVYLPGTNFNAATSTTLITALSTRWRVVCVDLPGQPGLSAAARPEDEAEGYARWIADVLRHVRQQHPALPVVLVGHSRGAAVALSADPADVDALVLVNPAGLAKVRLSAVMLWRSLAWLMRPTSARSGRLVGLMTGSQRPGLETLVEWLTLVARGTHTTGAPGPLPAAALDNWLGRDVRILAGAQDVFFPPDALRGPARRLGASLDVAPDAGHLLCDQRPELVVTAVAEALAA